MGYMQNAEYVRQQGRELIQAIGIPDQIMISLRGMFDQAFAEAMELGYSKESAGVLAHYTIVESLTQSDMFIKRIEAMIGDELDREDYCYWMNTLAAAMCIEAIGSKP